LGKMNFARHIFLAFMALVAARTLWAGSDRSELFRSSASLTLSGTVPRTVSARFLRVPAMATPEGPSNFTARIVTTHNGGGGFTVTVTSTSGAVRIAHATTAIDSRSSIHELSAELPEGSVAETLTFSIAAN
jgi:hypothetical protein